MYRNTPLLLLIPQRYEFSSKSQPNGTGQALGSRCCWYHKGTNFQANHNSLANCWYTYKLLLIPQRYEFSSKSQQVCAFSVSSSCCCWYHKGTNFQANHNMLRWLMQVQQVVADTTKVRIFKQITTVPDSRPCKNCCCWYHKGTNFQANHNWISINVQIIVLLLIPQRYEFSSKSQLIGDESHLYEVVADTTKVRIFKQITTL